MYRFIQYLQAIFLVCGCVVLSLLSLILWDAYKLMPRVNQILTDTNRIVIEAGAAVGNFEKAARTWEQSSQDQANNITVVTAKAGRDLDDLHNVIVKVGDSADVLTAQVNSLGTQATADANQISDTVAGMKPIVLNLTHVSDNLVRITGDPSILDSLHNVDTSTQHMSDSADNLAGITKDGRDIADKVRNDYLKPHKFAWELIKELLPIAYYVKGLL